ncbi:hypothetical protein EDC96DRAFT_450818, partial [Choanephora cucurbitarum]
ITNEHDTSPLFFFSFSKETSHHLTVVKKDEESLKSINGTSVCSRKIVVLNVAEQSRNTRESLSAWAIRFSVVSRLFDSRAFTVFNPSL